MFPYYGSKFKIIRNYPTPQYKDIIEPFAGSARYSELYSNRNIVINDKYSKVYEIWDWLINHATQNEILTNVNFHVGQDISKLDLHPSHIALIGFCVNRGSIEPKNIVQKWSCQVASKPNWASTTAYTLRNIANSLAKIKHWQCSNLDYRELKNVKATWFIDPPYQFGGEHYVENSINYDELKEWCLSRNGQVIICENTKSNWLDFKPLISMQGAKFKTIESIWTNNPTSLGILQGSLF